MPMQVVGAAGTGEALGRSPLGEQGMALQRREAAGRGSPAATQRLASTLAPPAPMQVTALLVLGGSAAEAELAQSAEQPPQSASAYAKAEAHGAPQTALVEALPRSRQLEAATAVPSESRQLAERYVLPPPHETEQSLYESEGGEGGW